MKTLTIVALLMLAGCTGPRVVFVPAKNAPMRIGPGVSGKVYVWNGTTWELSGNKVAIPEGLYIWDAGDPAPTNSRSAR
jgi:hypothetical protein